MAVFTDIGNAELAQFLDAYDIGELTSYQGIAEGVQNTNFLLQTTQAKFILTIYEEPMKREELPFFVELMAHLADNGVNTPCPVRNKTGEVTGELGGRPAAIVSFLEGMWPRRPSVAHCAKVGRALAEFHLVGESFPIKRENDFGLKSWRELHERAGDIDRIATGLKDEIDQALIELEAQWPKGLPSGVVHADLFPDNVFFLDEKLSGIIDLYFACNDVLAFDLAICMNAWCFEPDNMLNVTKARALMDGYQELRTLTSAEKQAFPLLCQGAAMRFIATRVYDWLNVPEGALVVPKNPKEYVAKLRFHRAARDIGAYGLNE